MTTSLTARPVPAPNVVADLPAAVPAAFPAPRCDTGVRPLRTPFPADVCPIELRALRTGARTLADALIGIALDAPCDRQRQGAVVDLARLVLGGVRSTAGRVADDAVFAAATAAREALPAFAHDISAGAPLLAMATTALADVLDERATDLPVHEHSWRASPLVCRRRFAPDAGPAHAVLPWFLDSADPAERVALVQGASLRARWALRLGDERYLRTVELVRG